MCSSTVRTCPSMLLPSSSSSFWWQRFGRTSYFHIHNDYGGRMFVYQTVRSHISGYLYLIEVLRTFQQHPNAVSF